MTTVGTGLRPRDLASLIGVFQRHHAVREVRLFGSRATGQPRRASDIDLAVLAPTMTAAEWARLRDDLENAPIPYALDVIDLGATTSATLRAAIDAEGISIYSV